MRKEVIKEGQAEIHIFQPEEGVVSKELEVFYNPLMKFNRDISILLLNSVSEKQLQIADPLAGSGVRAVRLLTELEEDKIKNIHINDYSEDAVELIKENIELNEERMTCDDIEVSCLDANQFLQESVGYDYIDIDPFGSPNHFLDNAIKRISRKGILAVTATDTSALSGTYPKAGTRKYWAKTIRQEHKHEAGIRILIRKCQLIAAQYDKELIPILTYSLDHYFRIFFKIKKSKDSSYESISSHRFFHYCSKCGNHRISRLNQEKCCENIMQEAGPLWSGPLFETKLLQKMIKNNEISENGKILQTFLEESKIKDPFFYDIHSICKKHKLSIPKTETLTEMIKQKGYNVSRTHFLRTALKTDMKFNEFLKLIKID